MNEYRTVKNIEQNKRIEEIEVKNELEKERRGEEGIEHNRRNRRNNYWFKKGGMRDRKK